VLFEFSLFRLKTAGVRRRWGKAKQEELCGMFQSCFRLCSLSSSSFLVLKLLWSRCFHWRHIIWRQ